MARLLIADLYEVLGVPESATADEVVAAYRLAARTAHPDAGGSHEAFLLVDLARRVLTDRSERAFYDKVLAVARLLASPRVGAPARGDLESDVFDELADAAHELERLSSVAVTIELREMLAAVNNALADRLEAAPRRHQRTHSGAGRARAQHRAPGVDWQEMLDEIRWHNVRQGLTLLRGWGPIREQLMDPRLPVGLARVLLHRAFVVYSTLRQSEATLLDRRRRRLARDEKAELEMEYSMLWLLADCATVIAEVGERVGRRYSTKQQHYFEHRLDEVVGLLRARGWDDLINRASQHPPRDSPQDAESGPRYQERRREQPRSRRPIAPCSCGAAPLIGATTCWEHSDPAVRRAAQIQAGTGRCAAQSRTGRPCPGITYESPLCPDHLRLAPSARGHAKPRRTPPRQPPQHRTPSSAPSPPPPRPRQTAEASRPVSPRRETSRRRARVSVMAVIVALFATGWLVLRWVADDDPSAAQRATAARQIVGCSTAVQLVWSDARVESNDATEARIDALRAVVLSCRDLDRQVLGRDLTSRARAVAESAASAAMCMTKRTFPGLACAPALFAFAAAASQLRVPGA